MNARENLEPVLEARDAELAQDLREVLRATPELEANEMETAQRELIRARRSALMGLRREGVISEDVFEQLVAEIETVADPAQAPAAAEDLADATTDDGETSL